VAPSPFLSWLAIRMAQPTAEVRAARRRLRQLRRNGSVVDSDLGSKIRTLRERVESALEKGQQLEL
jgi:hypothetical protein